MVVEQRKLIGMIGGLGPLATIYYYRLLVEQCRAVCGHAPRLLVYTIPVEEMCKHVREGNLDGVAGLLVDALTVLARAGAEIVFISANTPHIAWSVFERKARRLGLNPVSIVEATVEHVTRRGFRRVAILGTRRLYESRIYQNALKARGVGIVELPGGLLEEIDKLTTLVAQGEDRVGYRRRAAELIEEVAALGADAAILACTELPYLLEGVDASIELVDTAKIQVEEVIRRSVE